MMKNNKAQERINELGLVGRIGHNLAKYKMEIDKSYTAEGFIAVCRVYMLSRGMEVERMERIIADAKEEADNNVTFFMTTGKFVENHGGSGLWIGALLGPVLDAMGYEDRDIEFGVRVLKADFVIAVDDMDFPKAKAVMNLLQTYYNEVGFEDSDEEKEFRVVESWYKKEIEGVYA